MDNEIGHGRQPRFRVALSNANEPWWMKSLKAHPVTSASSLAFVVGGVMLLMFLGHLQELPDIDLSSSAALLWALAAMGGFVLVFVLALPMLPAIHSRGEAVTGNWRHSQGHHVVASMPAVVLIVMLLGQSMLGIPSAPFHFWFLSLFGFAWICIDYRRHGVSQQCRAEGVAGPSRGAVIGNMLMDIWAWIATLGLGFVFVTALYLPADMDGWPLMLVLVFQLGVLYAAALASARLDWGKERKVILVLAISTVVLPALASQNVTGIGVATVRALGLGERPARLVVTAAGCDTLNKAVGQRVCDVPKGHGAAVVCPAILRSRIGNPYFIELSPLGEGGRWPERKKHPVVPIAKADVLSWPRLDLSGQNAEGSAVQLQAVATAASTPISAGSTSGTSRLGPMELRRPYLTFLDEYGLTDAQKAWLQRECLVDQKMP